MKTYAFLTILALILVSTLSVAATDNSSFKGTYTFEIASTSEYYIEYNSSGGQVGFCTGQKIPQDYSCGAQLGQDVITGSITADGVGHVTGGSFSMRSDPNGPDKSGSGTLTGTYAVQSNGSGVLTLVPSGSGKSIAMAMILGPNAAGQIVNLVVMPAAGNGNRGAGAAVRQ